MKYSSVTGKPHWVRLWASHFMKGNMFTKGVFTQRLREIVIYWISLCCDWCFQGFPSSPHKKLSYPRPWVLFVSGGGLQLLGASLTRTLLVFPPSDTVLEISTRGVVILGSVRLLFNLNQLLIHEIFVEFQVSRTCETKGIEHLHDKNNALPEY